VFCVAYSSYPCRYAFYHCVYFSFSPTPPTSLYTLSLHDALPISTRWSEAGEGAETLPPTGSAELVLLALAEAHVALQPSAQGGIEGFEEGAVVAIPRLPTDLAADSFEYLAVGLWGAVPEDVFQNVQFVLTVDGEFRFAEGVSRRGFVAYRHGFWQGAAVDFDHPCPGDKIAGAQVVPVEKREQHEDCQPYGRRSAHRAEAVPQTGEKEGGRQKDFDVADQVA